ncbi:uncharacterized protein LOC133506208 [Syngnathoides biaculeatus]|uniref:uncharacterized protein LOC133506208 n=1 Tax=Syngnathoides biaculeatus TaxID=300417 RepID=UPI002ADE0F96|nr:uncharacterized protein LOC133506208 [Syngnathoides biaculeatus]
MAKLSITDVLKEHQIHFLMWNQQRPAVQTCLHHGPCKTLEDLSRMCTVTQEEVVTVPQPPHVPVQKEVVMPPSHVPVQEVATVPQLSNVPVLEEEVVMPPSHGPVQEVATVPQPPHVAVQEVAMGPLPSHVPVQEEVVMPLPPPSHVPVQEEVAMSPPPSHVPVQEYQRRPARSRPTPLSRRRQELRSSVEPPLSWRDFRMAVMVVVMAWVLLSIILFTPDVSQLLHDLALLVTNPRLPPDQASVATNPWSSRNHGVGGFHVY